LDGKGGGALAAPRSKGYAMQFELVDVFGSTLFSGNPVAVITGAQAIDPALYQRITQWFNLSETTFVFPPTHPDADYRVRIFTLEREMPFAGHPTLGTCHAWLNMGGVPKNPNHIIQECGAGLVPIRRRPGEGDVLSFRAPPLIRSGTVSEAELADVTRLLQIDRAQIVDAAWADNGPGWIAVMLTSAEAVLAVEPLRHFDRRIDVGLVGATAGGADHAFELRALFSDHNGTIVEDPVTGSLNASVAQWLRASGRVGGDYRAAQGARVGRAGRVEIAYSGDDVWVGGQVLTMFSGKAENLTPSTQGIVRG
jgi:PhzF family phenazine biosynthesis protein